MILAPLRAYSAVVLWGLLVLAPGLVRADVTCDGTNDVITTANVAGAPTNYPLAITMMLKHLTVSGSDTFLVGAGQTGTPASGYRAALRAGLIFWNNNVTAGAPNAAVTVPNNKWLYVAWAAASATSHRFYIWNYDDRTTVLNATSAGNMGAITAPGNRITICNYEGNPGTFGATYLNATVRQVAFYDKDWTASADPFKAMAYLGPYALATPKLLYNFQSTSGTAVREQQGTGNTGTLTNFAATPWLPMAFPRPLWVE
jgi:hypothetical protein